MRTGSFSRGKKSWSQSLSPCRQAVLGSEPKPWTATMLDEERKKKKKKHDELMTVYRVTTSRRTGYKLSDDRPTFLVSSIPMFLVVPVVPVCLGRCFRLDDL